MEQWYEIYNKYRKNYGETISRGESDNESQLFKSWSWVSLKVHQQINVHRWKWHEFRKLQSTTNEILDEKLKENLPPLFTSHSVKLNCRKVVHGKIMPFFTSNYFSICRQRIFSRNQIIKNWKERKEKWIKVITFGRDRTFFHIHKKWELKSLKTSEISAIRITTDCDHKWNYSTILQF